MKRCVLFLVLAAFALSSHGQLTNTLLWKITGKNLSKPSYLFGTMHMLCADDIDLSDSLKYAINNSDYVYLELEMDNMFEMIAAMQHMAMRNDTTLADLLNDSEYSVVKNYFNQHTSMLPFSMLETYKPLLTASLIAEQQTTDCGNMVAMEQLIMREAKKDGKKIKGLETMDYQLSIFDKIPYKLQAEQLCKMIMNPHNSEAAEIKKLTDAYRNQQLEKMEEMTRKEDLGIKNFSNLLLYDRNAKWAAKLNQLLPNSSLVIAVGAGHLPGNRGVINLLRKAGYKVDPVKNDMIRKKTKEI